MAAAVPLSHMKLSTRCELRSALWAGASQGCAGLRREQSGGGGTAVAHGAQHEVRAEASPLGRGVAKRRRAAEAVGGCGGAVVAQRAQHEGRAEVSLLGWGVAKRRRAAEAAERRRRCRCRK